MSDFRRRYGPWALVTGASSGIGREFARQLASAGLNVFLIARRASRLEALAAELERAFAIEARPVPVDLSEMDFLPAVETATAGHEVGLLVNSAGFSITGDFLDQSPERHEEMLLVKCRAPLLLAHKYAPAMCNRGRGGVVFISSVSAFASIPLWAHYAATNAYLLRLAEGVAGELKPQGVDVLALCPGTTRTEFLDVAEIDPFLPMDVDEVVAAGLAQLGRRRRVIPGRLYRAGIFATRFLPDTLNSYFFSRIIGAVRR